MSRMKAITKIEMMTDALYQEKIKQNPGIGQLILPEGPQEFQMNSNLTYKEYISRNPEYLRMQNELHQM